MSKESDESKQLMCEHKFVFLRTAKWTDDGESYNTKFVRKDTFFCEKCLLEKCVHKHDVCRDTPDWYRGE
jgi:hypothetical protein